ncbi:hypothetical protein [Arenibacter amylolyticus]|uniref:hypothetical protein n=1 Tax=Arenibacter amylolyticus TaxID=1406873 RepID=UPI000A3B3227|nr:hypothetical protein [Arenibacter amylolyticus]
MNYFKLKIVIVTLVGGLTFSCSDNDDTTKTANCDLTALISADQYANAPSHTVTINTLEIDNHCLKINYSSSGCSGDSWEVKLIDSGEIMESNPPQRTIRLSLKNEELCEAYITKEIRFNIRNLQVEGNRVVLNITNADQQLLYEY